MWLTSLKYWCLDRTKQKKIMGSNLSLIKNSLQYLLWKPSQPMWGCKYAEKQKNLKDYDKEKITRNNKINNYF